MAHIPMFSMSAFSDIILPAMEIAGAETICEIGVEFGGMSQLLADHCESKGGQLISVDPEPKFEFVAWAAANAHVRHVPLPSAEAFQTLHDIDAWVVDGDHNWYTVFYELTAMEAISTRDGKPFLAFMHDVCWPCGRRDTYYAPDRIPEEYRQPFDYEHGIRPGDPYSHYRSGFKGEGFFAFAKEEGGPRNGVKTAIEDFIDVQLQEGRTLAYAEVPAVFGLGVLFDMDATWSGALADLMMPYHENELLARMERNRIETFIRVIDHEDKDRFGTPVPPQRFVQGEG